MSENSPLPTKDENPNGLHQRYRVERLHGPTDPRAEYFVLRIDQHGKDKSNVNACRIAAKAWADAVMADDSASHLWKTANDLYLLMGLEPTGAPQ